MHKTIFYLCFVSTFGGNEATKRKHKKMKFTSHNFSLVELATFFVMSGNDVTGDSWIHESLLKIMNGENVSLDTIAGESKEMKFEVSHFLMLTSQAGGSGIRFGNPNLTGVEKFILHYLEKIGAVKAEKIWREYLDCFGQPSKCLSTIRYQCNA